MRYRPCDELGQDLIAAQTEWQCALDPSIAENVVEYISRNYGKQGFEDLLERGLDLEFVVDDIPRHAYKKALGLFFSKRAQYARQQVKEMNAIPFAPR